jgi:GNAT superfamily N-acetyltransferase
MVSIRNFELGDQKAARQLILGGLSEHWGMLDWSLNPDLNDIATAYADGIFLVAYWNDQLVGTGALIPDGPGVGRIVRMSVERSLRRQGIGRALLNALIERGRKACYSEIVLETTATWQDAVEFYKQCGFESVGFVDGDHHFRLKLE